MKIFLPLFLIVLVALVGCKKQPEMGSNLLVITAVKDDFDTKATETAFEVNDKIGVFINENVGNLPYETLDGINWKCLGFLNEFLAGKEYFATAYYPFSESAKDMSAIEVSSGIDFMIAEKTKLDISGNEAAGTLQFKHVLSKLLVTIDTPEEIDDVKTVSLDSVIVRNVFRKATININTNTFSNFSNKGDIVVSNGEAIIIPQTVSRIEFVFKMASGGFSKLSYVKELTLESGKKTTLNAHSNADLYFASLLDLKSGEAQSNLPLSIFVATGRRWTLKSSETWLTFSKTSGTGKGLETITVNVTQNAGVPRAATLTLADDKPSKTIAKTMQNYVRTVTIAGTKWTTRNLTGSYQGQTTGFTLAANPQDYGMFWKWGSKFAYDRISANVPVGHWIAETTWAATSPTMSGTGSYGYDYVGVASSDGAPVGDPCKVLGANYRTPTRQQFIDLVASGRSDWATYQGVNGRFFGVNATSCNNATIAPKCIFLPAAGFRDYKTGLFANEGNYGDYWSSSISTALISRDFDFAINLVDPSNNAQRGFGISVRCVEHTPPPVTTVTIASTRWTTANLTGNEQGQTSGFEICASPSDHGMFWKWGSLYMYNRVGGNIPAGHWGTTEATFNYGAATQPTTQSRGYDYAKASGIMNTGGPAGDPCKALGAYRTPTQAQWAALVTAGKSAWTTYQGVAGYFFGPSAASCNNTTMQAGCIFLPAAGGRSCNGGILASVGSGGRYWSSSVNNSDYGWFLEFNNGGVYSEDNFWRGHGFSVRCVAE